MRWLVCFGVAFAVAAPAIADADPAEPFHGAWVRVDTERDDAARFAEIDRATASMSAVFRGFARALMRRRMQPVARYVVADERGVATIRSDIGESYPLDGTPRGGAEADAVVSRIENGEIRQSWRHGNESFGETVWRLDPSGERLVITEQVNDPHFSEPIEFATSYARESTAP